MSEDLPKKRRIAKRTLEAARDVDYWAQLSPNEVEWLRKFLLEFYQGDFSEKPNLHPDHLKSDCYDRGNIAFRSIDSVGKDILDKAMAKAGRRKDAYMPSDYFSKDLPLPGEDDEWEDF